MTDNIILSAPSRRGAQPPIMEDSGRTTEREFYRYYHHSQRPKGHSRQPSPVVEPALPPSPVASGPRTSEDKALTAFAQLGALRLNTRRCLISFFDRRDCYILAEATKTLSLSTGRPEFRDDTMCWGTSIFPKEKSICYYTVKLPFIESDPLDEHAEVPSLVVNDLSQDNRFKNYPFVAGPPYSRFYAGVPIRAPSGHSIGTYCVLDDKPRDGITEFELAFLKDMATTVMRHLQMSRATDDHKRGGIMVKSLGSFADGRSSLEEWLDWESEVNSGTNGQADADVQRPRRPTLSPTVSTTIATQMSAFGSGALARNDSNVSSITSRRSTNPTSPSGATGSTTLTPASETVGNHTPEVTTKTASSTKKGEGDMLSPELKTIFSRAAQMIVDATEAEGAIFFDAKVSTWGGLVDDDVLSELPPEPNKPCVVLGAAHSKGDGGETAASYDYSMTENVLKHFLRNYAHGQIFNMEDDSGISVLLPTSVEESEFGTSVKSECSKTFDEDNMLKKVFPHAKSLILYPLWDTHRDRWYASIVIWSTDPMRVFTSEQELSYLAAFSNSVMAEVARLDTKLADSAKADFISSISHELRSPLHGILGMTDLLKLTRIDSQQDSLIQTIETCGKTLLDTINHVLDYAKINNLTRGSSKQRKKRSKTAKQISPAGGHTNDIMTIISDIDMSVLAEEALDSVFAGFHFQQTAALDNSSDKPDPSPVAVIVDINKNDNYVFRTQPGAWRRVIMNLFGNALKYTKAGYIKIKLQIVPNNDPNDDYAELRLIVADSGIGMSESYINNRLFHSFAQENPLSQGTGLGLSIVKQLVELLGGDVEVRSEKDHGTKFTVSCPMKRSILSPSPATSLILPDRSILNVRKRTDGLNVHFVGFDDEDDYFPVKSSKSKNATKLTKKAVDCLCVDWFGMKTWKHGAAGAPAPDLFMATEAGAQYLRLQYNQDPEKAQRAPVVVVCRGAASAQSTTAITVPGLIIECTAQPCGPHKLSRALSSCLDRWANRVMVESISTDTTSISPRISQLNLKENCSPPNPRVPIPAEPSRPTIASTISAPEIRSFNSKPVQLAVPSISLNCLAVDDNPINLRLLQTFVQKLGHTHMLAKTGLEALGAYKSVCATITSKPDDASALVPITTSSSPTPTISPGRIDVILMDINMPEMDGLEATRQIRAHERDNGLSPVTIIALTGLASTDAQQEAHASGVNLFMIKPVRLAELDTILKGVIKSGPKTVGRGDDEGSRVSETSASTEEEAGVEDAGRLEVKGKAEAHARSKSEM
ncbi:hypothetical protein P280DRAFT_423680 [Massarina eburnea CBS 473.64]|uniref:Sensor histidine kinase-like protein/response regulator n=1 Tax=Massarina eburnea CBS 473.64 TaxID=1395130 RepID=A0A6A6S4U3_9PLEO|nr:hypothetical protein P280DRAFT_423680 [Massarina eburnea CBS 473.64]